MTYTEEVTDRLTKITEEIASAWMDLRMEVGEDDVSEWSKPDERRAGLIEQAADILNEIEGIDAAAKRKADALAEKKAKEAADLKAMQDRINQSVWHMANLTATPRHLLSGPYFRSKTPVTDLYRNYVASL
ncbi:hypothetical protein [Kribbella italica]|uniref:Uncharacterized protein n=1 Tax=Kribbella italica TaxID=1540520 RepID=A0A7W9MRZ5_9ACTN|nr:hypothetical protein [Kribbella italica]MBB5833388.1 hypothetical protein [Kribbella italica]